MLFGGRKKRRFARVLVVEDEPLVAFDTEHFLSDEGYTVVATVDGVADALEVIAQTAVDLAVIDVRLSDGSGLDVARAAREHGITILFVTGAMPEEAVSLATGCLAKPYHKRDLVGAIEAIEAIAEGREPKRLPPGLRLFGDVT